MFPRRTGGTLAAALLWALLFAGAPGMRAVAVDSAEATESAGAEAAPAAVDALAEARDLANRAREAVEAGAPDAATVLGRADAASAALACRRRDELEVRLHVLRSRMLFEGREASGDAGGRAALPVALAAVAASADELADASVVSGFARLYLAELQRDAGQPDEADATLARVLALPERPETFEPRARAGAALAAGLLAAGQPAGALAALRRAVRLVDEQRGRIGAAEFLAIARPIHEQLADLLLRESARRPQEEQSLLREALDALEVLKVAELREYFGDECLLMLEETTPELVAGTLLLYPVLLPDRVELITGSGERLERIVSPSSATELQTLSRRLRGRLQDPTGPRYREPATRLYDALIRPLGERVHREGVTLTYVPWGGLREVPIAALYDSAEDRFLIEQVAVATLPTLRVLVPQPIDPRRARLLGVGLTGAREGFAALPAVGRELDAATDHFRGEQRVDAAFTEQGLESALDERAFDIVHIASHGRFDARASESYLLTFDGRLSLPELARIVAHTRHRTSRPIELLTLSACETAIGDDRAVLGLAGVAVQSGARSAVATLWRVNDEAAAALFEVFYAELAKPGQSRAGALQRAQLALLSERRFRHPIHWSAFLLINSWL